MKTVLTVTAGIALCAAFASPRFASAGPVPLLTDGSLETTLAPDQYGMVTASTTQDSNALNGWTITRGCVDVVPSSYWQSALGSYSVDMIGTPYYNNDSANGVDSLGGISQTITTIIGDTYTLTFDLTANPSNLTGEAASTKHLTVKATPVGSSTADAKQTYNIANQPGQTLSNMMYTSQTFQFTATTTQTTLSLQALMPTGLSPTFNADNVFCGPVIDDLILLAGGSPTPEPASLSLLGVGGLVLLRRRPRRRA